ncbi:winged helix-turn-helix domain-containing protein [Dokdonella koreensis]|uniref:Transcriptional regulatory protein, HTH DNA binding domain n=1 Tax=Dokdonella koreensis DS-123 TaxID=1300342 RepID=A0A160DYH3_9GAMM|nr:winged helix-turn-helix domain-containing protein [Dokdonella koreensis]ANB19664.1 Putative transcriptional regulatory protein, HTH DNA binding domain [Dokdonella koreensis DS-123]
MTTRLFRFEDFRLDAARRELWQGGERLVIPPKVFDCIAYLVEHRDRAVGRDELIAAVWGKADVTDNLLDQVMLRARRALGDTAEQRRFILTMPRFGFSWVAPTEEVAAPGASPVAMPSPALPEAPPLAAAEPAAAAVAVPARQARVRRWPGAVAVLAALVLAAVAAAWLHGRRPADTAVASAAPAALVLPVEVRAEGAFGWVRLGVMDLVAERLRLTGRPVLPSDNVVALTRDRGPWTRGSPAAADLGRVAGASLLIAGEAVLAEGRWRVALRTILGTDNEILVEGQASDVLDAARLASDQLEAALGWSPGSDDPLPGDPALALLLRQVDAALLADQTGVARRLLDGLDPDHRTLPEVRFRHAAVDFRDGDLAAAQAGYEALLGSLSADDAPLLRARVLSGLGNVHLRRGQPAELEALSDQAIGLLAGQPPSAELGRALTGRAIARSTQGDFDAAMEDFARARIVLESVGDRFGLTRVEVNIGILDARRNRYAEALPVLTAAADRLTAFGDFTNELYARVALARARLELLDPAAALAGDERLRELIQNEPSPALRRYASLVRLLVQNANGRLRAGQVMAEALSTDAAAAGDGVMGALAAAMVARAALAQGDAARAAAEAARALQVDWSNEGPLDYARTWRILAVARQQVDAPAEAQATLAALRDWVADRTDGGIRIQLALAEGALAPPAQARTAYEQALALAETRRVPAELIEIADAYLPWLIREGDLARAGVLAGRTAGWAGRDYEAALLQLRLQHALGNLTGWRNALARARTLAGERVVPAELLRAPSPQDRIVSGAPSGA